MRRFLVALVVCAAVATADEVDDDFNSYDAELNNVGIFMPRSLKQGSMDRAVRAFYYKYWLYPGMALKNSHDMSPYMDYNYVEPLTFQDVFEKPVFVVTPSQNVPNTFSMFYLHNGLRTLHRYNAFSWLQEFFKRPGLKGLIFYPDLIYNVRFFETPVSTFTMQEDMRMSDFVSIENCKSGKIPYIFVAPEIMFDRMHFENIAKVSDFKVYGDAIEVQPLISQPRPVYEPFYGPQSQQQLVQPGSSVNAMDFTSHEESYMERPALVQSEKMGATHIGRGAYGDDVYVLAGRIGQNERITGQYVDNEYEQPELLRQGGSLNVHTAQASSSLYHPGAIISGKTVQSVIQPVAQSTTISPSGAQLGVLALNAQRDTQVKYFGPSKGSGNLNYNDQGNQGISQMGISRVESGQISEQAQGSSRVGANEQTIGLSRAESSSNSNQIGGSQTSGVSESKTIEVVTVSGQHAGQAEGVSRLEGVQSASESVSTSKSVSKTNQIISSQPSGAQSIEVVTVSRTQATPQAPGQSAIHFPTEGAIEGVAGAGLQGGSEVKGGSVSRTETIKFGGAQGGLIGGQGGAQGGLIGGQGGAQGGLIGGLNAGGFSMGNAGGIQRVTQTFTVSGSADPTGNLFRTGGNLGLQGGVGGNFGIQGGVGGGSFGVQEGGHNHNVLGGLLKAVGSGVTKIVKTVDTTSHSLGDIFNQNEQLEQPRQSGSSVVTVRNVETSTIGESAS